MEDINTKIRVNFVNHPQIMDDLAKFLKERGHTCACIIGVKITSLIGVCKMNVKT